MGQYNALTLRPHVQPSTQVMTLIAPSHCWHFDAWLFMRGDDAPLLCAQTRSGGRDLLTNQLYEWTGAGLIARPDNTIEGGDYQPVTLQDRALWPRFDELNELHWRHVVPMAARVPAGYRSRSVALHYIRAPSYDPLPGDVVNMSQYD